MSATGQPSDPRVDLGHAGGFRVWPEETVQGAGASAEAGVEAHALVVDVDGTLTPVDLLWEGAARLLFRRPLAAIGMARALLGGKAALKQWVARHRPVDIGTLPLEQGVLNLTRDAQHEGRPVVLASAADEGQVRALAHRIGAADYIASDGRTNLRGRTKLDCIRERWPHFDYVGNSWVDLPIWAGARTAYGVRPSGAVKRAAVRQGIELKIICRAPSITALLWRALRPHQWAKNCLLFLPAFAAHLPLSPALVLQLLVGFLAFSALASAVYLINDIGDLAHDRQHPRKRERPIAAGLLPIPLATAAAAVLALLAAACALVLPFQFGAILLGYAALTTAYSTVLKGQLVIDVIALALLYTVRVIGGGILAGVELSPWFTAFSIFIFISLVLMKRTIELRVHGGNGDLPGRAYQTADLPILIALGVASTIAAALVYCLYITSPVVVTLYTRPAHLWAGLPLLLYWTARAWILANRGQVHDDPVVFALRDRMSWVVIALFGIVLVSAA